MSEPVVLDREAVARMLHEAAEMGARRALASVGLHDEGAAGDLRDLRGLLDAWRSVKRTAGEAVVKAAAQMLLTALAAGAAVLWWKG